MRVGFIYPYCERKSYLSIHIMQVKQIKNNLNYSLEHLKLTEQFILGAVKPDASNIPGEYPNH